MAKNMHVLHAQCTKHIFFPFKNSPFDEEAVEVEMNHAVEVVEETDVQVASSFDSAAAADVA